MSRQITITLPDLGDLLPRRDLLKGWRTVIVNGTAVLYGAAATVAPEVLLPSPEWVTPAHAAGLAIVALGMVNGCLRAITSTPLGEREERVQIIRQRVTVPAPTAPVDYWAAREEHLRAIPRQPETMEEAIRAMNGQPITAADILDLGDKDELPSLTAPYQGRQPDKPTFALPASPAVNAGIGFAIAAPLWGLAGLAGWLS